MPRDMSVQQTDYWKRWHDADNKLYMQDCMCNWKMEITMQNKIMLIGLGPHARTYYVKIVELLKQSHDIEISVIVDLKCQEESIRRFLDGNHLSVNHLEFIDDANRNNEHLTLDIVSRLDGLSSKYGINKVIISTEPKAHKAYALWAASRDIPALMDKPLTAVNMNVNDPQEAYKLSRDYEEITSAFHNSQTDLYVMALRRVHPALVFAREYLNQFVSEFKVPITHISISHSEGMWNMPNEFFERENHPYKFGYGLMLHSGYHFIDLFLLFVRINNQLDQKNATDMDYSFSFSTASDLNRIVDDENYQSLLSKDFKELKEQELKEQAEDFGEIDMHILCNVNHDGKLMTTGVIDLLQTSYSTRYRWQLPEDTYKDNGRTYHEFISVEVGHLLNIKLMCFTNGKAKDQESASKADERYKILIYRNSNLVGGKSFEEIVFDKNMDVVLGEDQFCLNMGTSARLRGVYNWLFEEKKASLLDTHRYTIDWLTGLYKAMFEARLENSRLGKGKLELKEFADMPTL